MKDVINEFQQNKGMSLMEVLISVAISMIVMIVAATFISNGSIFFKKQSKTIDLQNELMETSNRINDALLQSTDELTISVGTNVNGAKIYTGSYDSNTKKFTSGKGSARFIEWNKQNSTLYVMDVVGISDDTLKQGYLMGSHVSDISISVSSDCQVMQVDNAIITYKQPLILEVSVSVTKDGETRKDSRVVTLRNELDRFELNGKVFTPNENGLLVINQ